MRDGLHMGDGLLVGLHVDAGELAGAVVVGLRPLRHVELQLAHQAGVRHAHHLPRLQQHPQGGVDEVEVDDPGDEEDDALAAAAEGLEEPGLEVEPRPLRLQEVLGEDNDYLLGGLGDPVDGVGDEGVGREVAVVEADPVGVGGGLQLPAQHLVHEQSVPRGVGHVCVEQLPVIGGGGGGGRRGLDHPLAGLRGVHPDLDRVPEAEDNKGEDDYH